MHEIRGSRNRQANCNGSSWPERDCRTETKQFSKPSKHSLAGLIAALMIAIVRFSTVVGELFTSQAVVAFVNTQKEMTPTQGRLMRHLIK